MSADWWQAQELLDQQEQIERASGFSDVRLLIRPVKANALSTDTIMPKINEMLPSKYLKQSDVDQDYIVTIEAVEEVNVAAQDADRDEFKWTVRFKEFDKPMVLNSTNIQALGKACNSDDTDDWIGKEVIVFTDPNVSYGGKVVGGLRIKSHRVAAPVAPKGRPLPAGARQASARTAAPAAAPAETGTGFDQMEDDIPF